MIHIKTHKFLVAIVMILLPLLYVGCKPKSHTSDVIAELSASVDTLYTPLYAKGYDVLGSSDSAIILLDIKNPWQGAENISKKVILNYTGTPLSEKYDNADVQIIDKVPERIVCTSSTQVAMLEAMGLADKIVGVSGKQFISSDYIKRHSAEIVDIGYDNQVDYEKLVSTHPDLVLLYGVSGPNIMESKLRDLGIPYFYVGEYLEELPLGKTEWLIPLASILNEHNKGKDIFDDIKKRYQTIKYKTQTNQHKSPLVMLNTPYQDIWYMPAVESYLVQLIKDAGGEYIISAKGLASASGNKPVNIDKETALMLGNEADVWLNPGANIDTKEELLRMLPTFKNTKILRTGKIYNNNLRVTPGGGNDFFEGGIMNPDKILEDLIQIFHPVDNALNSDSVAVRFTYYKEIR